MCALEDAVVRAAPAVPPRATPAAPAASSAEPDPTPAVVTEVCAGHATVTEPQMETEVVTDIQEPL